MLMRMLAAALMVLWMETPVLAQICGAPDTEVLLAKGKIPSGVTWSAAFQLTSDGLQQLPENYKSDIWIQTHKIPVGIAWRPPSSSTVSLSIYGNGAKDYPIYAYVRYGCDGVHWSSWYPMQPSAKLRANSLATYTCYLRLPNVAFEKFCDLEKEWEGTKPDWDEDTDACCRWIAKNHPRFFEDEIPFLGYVQFRLETFTLESRKCTKLIIGKNWCVGGMAHIRPDGNQTDNKKEWCFELTREDKTVRKKSSKLVP
jgi:hypothetical protein